MACWVFSSSSLMSSWGRTGMMVRAVMPCVTALSFEWAFPVSVLGPVLFWELRRLASICAAVAMVSILRLASTQENTGVPLRVQFLLPLIDTLPLYDLSGAA